MTEGISNHSGSCERSKLAMKLGLFTAVLAFVLAALTLILSFGKGWSGLGTFTLGAIPFVIAGVFGIAAFFYGMLRANAEEEEYEKELLKKRKKNASSILDVSEDVRFTAGKTFENYLKYAPSVFAIIGTVIVAIGLWQATARLRLLGAAGLPLPKAPMTLAFVCVIGAAIALFSGVFMAGQSRISEFRWLRPAGAWMAAGAFIWLFAAIPAAAQNYGNTALILPFAKIVFWVLAILGAEFIVSFVIEFYRPRTQVEDRPVHESRILSLFVDPGSMAKNIADTLDYQFGFKVSGTWMYRKFCHVALPAIFGWLVILWVFTGIAEVGPGELGLRVRFGKLISEKPLEPGLYLKLPWPCEDIMRINVEEPRQVVVGVSKQENPKEAPPQDDEHGEAQPEQKKMQTTILWTQKHSETEIPFLVANDSSSAEINNAVSLLNAVLPVVYKVRAEQVLDYAFQFTNHETALCDLASREATIYFASTDFIKDMSVGRETISKVLRERIQKAADKAHFGIEILNVDLTDTHPPVEGVAAAFQDVFIARENMGASIEKAKAYSTVLVTAAEVEKNTILSDAATYRYKVTQVSESEANQFRSQLAAYKSMPEMFKLRTYLDFLENDCASLRKYIVSESISYQILELNAEEKPRLDLLDADLGGPIN